jgi:hypothetical protein
VKMLGNTMSSRCGGHRRSRWLCDRRRSGDESQHVCALVVFWVDREVDDVGVVAVDECASGWGLWRS